MTYVKGEGYIRFSKQETPCVLCGKPGGETTYYRFEEDGNISETEVYLCGPHKGTYMRGGIKKLDEIMKDRLPQSVASKELRRQK